MKTSSTRIAASGLLFMLILCTTTSSAFAQQYRHRNGQANRDKMEAERAAFISKSLELTPAEAKAFWPVYDEYDLKRHELRKAFQNSEDLHKPEIDKLTEKEANLILDTQLIEAQKLLDLRKEYHAKFRAILPAIKVLRLYDAEREFQKMLIDKLRKSGHPVEPR
jgi:hypothetical protein